MALGIWFVGLILLVQSIGLFVRGETGGKHVDDSCRRMEKLISTCDSLGSDSSPTKNKCTFDAHSNNNSLTFYHNFSEDGRPKEFRVSLFKGINKTSSVCEGYFNATQLPFDCNNCRVIPSASQVTFHLQSLNENDTDIYFFCKEVMYPPPYICECDKGTVIHVKGLIQHKDVVVVEVLEIPLSVLIILGFVVAYSLIITTSFIYIMRNRRRTRIQQSEYINVVPRRPKNHKPYIPYAVDPIHSRIH